MKIQRTNYCPSFNAKFTNNEAFREVVQYAADNNCLRTLDSALNTLKKTDDCIITATHGVDSKGAMYSTFLKGRRSVSNSVSEATSPAHATFDGILELSWLGRKFRSLVGTSQPEQNITKESLVKEYSV